MPTIALQTEINAPQQTVFDLARDIDAHMASTAHTGERAIAGRTSGLIELGEQVTWRAKHLGVWQTLTSKITEMEAPHHFVDEMVQGAFKSFRHEHRFTAINPNKTLMLDVFQYQSPLGVLGKIADKLFLEKYMRDLLIERNRVIKNLAESQTRG